MKVIIAGSRWIADIALIMEAIDQSGYVIDEIVSGGAKGPDTLAIQTAQRQGIRCRVFPADWGKHGRAAGPIRNRQMAEYADALIAIWDGVSKGTGHMIALMEARDKAVFVYRVSA
ncbi:MAG: DUF2493 domain-containing protein [Chloroflexota bacterium]